MGYLVVGLAVVMGLVKHYDNVQLAKINPPKSPAQRRAEREDCRKKGL